MACNVQRLTTILAVVLFSTLLAQAPDTLWTKSIGGNFDEMFNSVAPIPGGGFILGGHTESNADTIRNYWLVRLNSTGDDTLWTKVFPAGDKEGRMAIATSDSGFVIVGSGGDPMIIKTDSNGVLEWQITADDLDGRIYGIEETADGDFIACGTSAGGPTSATVARITADGVVTWEKTYGPPHDSYLLSITELSTGEFAAAGTHRTLPEPNSSNGWLFMLSATGDSLKSYFFGDPAVNNDESFEKIRATADSGFILVGKQTLDGQSQTPFLVKTDSVGLEEWSKTFTGIGISELFDVIQTSDSGFTLTGYGDLTLSDGFNMVVIHLAADGTTDWTKQINGIDGAGLAATEISSGEYLVVGAMIPESDSLMDGWIVRFGDPTAQSTTPAGAGVPEAFALHTNYPNPFNPSTTIGFDLPAAAVVTLTVYDILGREMAQLENRHLGAGYHQATWDGRTSDGREVPTGIYFARIRAAEYSRTIKMLLLK